MDHSSKQEEVLRSISVLSRTRESLSASGCISDSDGQLLEKALAKQLNLRRAELDSSTPPTNTSVIVRTSTPVPGVLGGNSRRFVTTPARSPNPNPSFFAPEDRDLPLRTLLQDLQSYSLVDLQPHGGPAVIVHQAEGDLLDITENFVNSPLAPSIPWSPVRQFFDLNETVSSFPTVPDEIHSSPLLAPLVVDSSKKKMDDAEKECRRNVRQFERTLRLTNPNGKDPGFVSEYHKSWYEDLKTDVTIVIDAIEELCIDFGQTLGPDRVRDWKETITTCENEFNERGEALWTVVRPPPASGPALVVPAPLGQGGNQSHRPQEAIADVTVGYGIIVAEGSQLKRSIKSISVGTWQVTMR